MQPIDHEARATDQAGVAQAAAVARSVTLQDLDAAKSAMFEQASIRGLGKAL
jgi:hypothetical protein